MNNNSVLLRDHTRLSLDPTLFLPSNPKRQGEGGLRKSGTFKRSQSNKPLISILTAVFNSASSIEKTILSVLSQDYDNLEFIIIDGGSTDGTVDIIKKYENSIDYWVSEQDKGISDAFNKAVNLAAGDYVNFQGAGDYLLSNSVVSEMMQSIDLSRDLLICGRVQRVSDSNDDRVLWVAPKVYREKFDKRTLLFKMSLPHQALFTHKKMFEMYGIFDLNNLYCMDYEHLLRAYKNFPPVVLKNIMFSAWREGGVGTQKVRETLSEYGRIKVKNKVAPIFFLQIISLWIFCKYYMKCFLVIFKKIGWR
ncbi:glycosyltransferase family 2 protein [Methylomonas sp. MK1]|uniref:glycosyltransferase family 2 protein n=1 Tax=Methylomonas sp. MK1 TaxID=1131552 RepID=UPI000365BF83|nr:glycosyltransferase family 2 protein [Methylomonas sp. MK1]